MRKTKTILSVLLTAAMLLTMFTAVPFSVSAAGNTWDPDHGVYDISTEEDLFAFRDSLNTGELYYGEQVNLLEDIEISEGTDYVSPCSNDPNMMYIFAEHLTVTTILSLILIWLLPIIQPFLSFLISVTLQ